MEYWNDGERKKARGEKQGARGKKSTKVGKCCSAEEKNDA